MMFIRLITSDIPCISSSMDEMMITVLMGYTGGAKTLHVVSFIAHDRAAKEYPCQMHTLMKGKKNTA